MSDVTENPEMDEVLQKWRSAAAPPISWAMLKSDFELHLRIEALRAAVGVLATIPNVEQNLDLKWNWAAETVFDIAEQFAAWLETGKR